MEYKLGLLCFAALSLVSVCAGQRSAEGKNDDEPLMTNERRLYHKLLDNYLPALRPVSNTNHTLKVYFGAALYSINELDEKQQTLSTTLWLRKLWKDFNLEWNPEDYGGVTAIRVPADKIWKPDIVLYNSRSDLYQYVMNVHVVVYNTGDVLWIPPINLISSCQLDMRNFPFDEQTCALKFGSWTFDGYQVLLDLYEGKEGFDLSDYETSSEWDVTQTSGRINTVYYPCCDEPYPDMTFNITMKRRSHYYSYMFVGPGVVLSLLIPFMFILPARSLQKVPLGIGIAISLVLLVSMLENFLPAAIPSVPIIAFHYVGSLVIVCISLGLNAFLANFAHRGSRVNSPPDMMKKVFLGVFRRLTCITEDPSQDTEVVKTDPIAVREWEIMGMVIDRLLFVVFLIIVILECIAVFS